MSSNGCNSQQILIGCLHVHCSAQAYLTMSSGNYFNLCDAPCNCRQVFKLLVVVWSFSPFALMDHAYVLRSFRACVTIDNYSPTRYSNSDYLTILALFLNDILNPWRYHPSTAPIFVAISSPSSHAAGCIRGIDLC